MLIILDKTAPEAARKALEKEGEVVLFQTKNICYEAIAGHPDVFFFQHPGGLIIAPNIPEKYKKILADHCIQFTEGFYPVGERYPFTARYNALYTSKGLLHNNSITDKVIKNYYPEGISCKQGYVRCTTIQAGELFITSDKGIERNLKENNLITYYINPENIILKNFNHGFFGGCCGLRQKKLYICGGLRNINNYKFFTKLVELQGIEISEIYPGVLHDVGGILLLE